VVARVAQKYPELLRSVAFSDPGLILPTTPEGKAAWAAYREDTAKSWAAAKSGDAKQSVILLFNAVSDDPGAFEKAPRKVQQGWLDNARTMLPMFAGTPSPPMTCGQLAALKVPALVIRGEYSRAGFRYTDEALLSCLPKGTEQAVVPNAGHVWYPVNPRAGAQALLAFVAKH
jgi:pimeloyl-ACP methyl ester carboxylesterase